MIFKWIAFDSAPLAPRVQLFDSDETLGANPDDGAAAAGEQLMVKWILCESSARELLLLELRRKLTACADTEVGRPFYEPNEGDIDLLVWDCDSPHQAAGLEFKRVKIAAVDAENDSVNKLSEVRKGVRQANRLHSLQISQTYFVLILDMDARRQTNFNIPSRGLTSGAVPGWDTSTTTLRQLRNFPGRSELCDEIGIVFLEVVRPSEKPFDERWSVGICVEREAIQRPQPPAVTHWVAERMSRRD